MSGNQNNEKRAIVIGANYASILTMVRDLGEAGYRVCVLRVFKKRPSPINLLGRMTPEAKSKYVEKYRTCVMKGDNGVLCRAIEEMAEEGEKALLVPVEDFLVSAVDACYEQLTEHFILQNINHTQNGINKLMDKSLQKELAKEHGVPVLPSTTIYSEDVPDDVVYPCFVKPAVSKDSSKLKMTRCEDRKDLADALADYAKAGAVNVLAEAFAKVKDEYAMVGFSTGESVVIPGLFRTSLPGHRERKGVAVMGEVTYKKGLYDLIPSCETFVSDTGYTGMFDLDFIETTEGELYFIEMNFRAGASERAFTKAGANIPAAFAEAVFTGEAPTMLKADISEERFFVNEKSLLEEYVRNDMTARKFKQCLKQADVFFIQDDKDPEPYGYFRKYVRMAKYLRVPYKIRDSRR